MPPLKLAFLIAFFALVRVDLFAQTILQGALATSQQDDLAVRFSLHKPFNSKFTAGLHLHYGSPNYRFIAAQPIIDEGYAVEVMAPLKFQISQEEKLQLFAFIGPGLRFQGVIDPDGNDQRDSLLSSTAVLLEPGLLLNINSTERLRFHSGITFPIAFEIDPTSLFENLTTTLHGGLSYQIANQSRLFLKSTMGAAFGASGDSQKFIWSLSAGGRVALGEKKEILNLAAPSTTPRKMGWFLTPEVGAIFHGDHLGKTLGAALGISIWKHRLKVGFHIYGRPGPINGQTFQVEAANGQTYKGNSTLTLRGDHGAFGLLLAPTFSLGNWEFDIPITLGNLGGGFYLFGKDRETPDGARVSEWENKLMDSADADFSNFMEFGLRAFAPLKTKGMRIGAGLHYTLAPDWTTYYDPSGELYHNKLRLSLLVHFAGK